MKYLEEISPGDCFIFENKPFILTTDFKRSGDRLSYRLDNGKPFWLKPNVVIDINPIYYLDKDNNLIPLKTTPKI